MKRLLILTAVAMLSIGAIGCNKWFNRGSQCATCGPGGGPMMGDTYLSPPVTTPGYLPGPQ